MATSSSSSSEPVPLDNSTIHKSQNSHELKGFGDGGANGAHDDDPDLYDDYHGHLKSNRHRGTQIDKNDMKRMGKQQELRRNFRTLSTLAFTVILQGTWEVLLAASYQGMVAGGLAGLIWSYVWTFACNMLVVVSLAEMASMAPTAGGENILR
jgi:amino acid permease